MIYPVQVRPGGTAVAGVLERLVSVEVLHAFAHVPLLGEYARADVHPHAADGVDDLLEAHEVNDHVVVYLHAREVLHNRPRLVDPAVGEGAVDTVLLPFLHLHIEVAGYGEQLDLPRSGNDPGEHHGVRARRRTLTRVRPTVDAEDEHIERVSRRLLRVLHRSLFGGFLFGCLFSGCLFFGSFGGLLFGFSGRFLPLFFGSLTGSLVPVLSGLLLVMGSSQTLRRIDRLRPVRGARHLGGLGLEVRRRLRPDAEKQAGQDEDRIEAPPAVPCPVPPAAFGSWSALSLLRDPRHHPLPAST